MRPCATSTGVKRVIPCAIIVLLPAMTRERQRFRRYHGVACFQVIFSEFFAIHASPRLPLRAVHAHPPWHMPLLSPLCRFTCLPTVAIISRLLRAAQRVTTMRIYFCCFEFFIWHSLPSPFIFRPYRYPVARKRAMSNAKCHASERRCLRKRRRDACAAICDGRCSSRHRGAASKTPARYVAPADAQFGAVIVPTRDCVPTMVYFPPRRACAPRPLTRRRPCPFCRRCEKSAALPQHMRSPSVAITFTAAMRERPVAELCRCCRVNTRVARDPKGASPPARKQRRRAATMRARRRPDISSPASYRESDGSSIERCLRLRRHDSPSRLQNRRRASRDGVAARRA